MRGRLAPFNINLLLAVLALLAAGCASLTGSNKEGSSLKFHIETNPGDPSRTGIAAVGRARPVHITIDLEPVIFENHIESAAVMETDGGGFAILVKFNDFGTALFESITTAHRSKRLVIGSRFTEARWLAAPMIIGTEKKGVIAFTPDATRKEAERIVRGLNNLLETARKK
ncbi:MAG: hypothetical protein EXS29_07870 [Pedosphaera sp.]|nr:hypothetical protein [Pedosphaera sp.]MST01211.1 hypothetical protein [Pedosphaera sp.]